MIRSQNYLYDFCVLILSMLL